MSTSEFLKELETCAQIILAPPDKITVNDRTKAEAIFLNFQKTKDPFELCREILETSQNQYVLFQTGICLKTAVIREWPSLGLERSHALFHYLFEYINLRQLDQYVIEEFMVVSAIIIKRISLENLNMIKNMIFTLHDIIKNPTATITLRLNACSSIIQILNEHCTLNYNSDYGLSWYSHLLAKRTFENISLKDIFKSAMEALYNHIKLPVETQRTTEWIKLCSKLIRICEIFFTWNFDFTLEAFSYISAQYAKSRDRIESHIFDPPADWVDFIVDGTLISFFFQLYLTVRNIDPHLLHSSLNCLTQLGTMTPTRFPLALRVKFSELMMVNTISLCNIVMDVISLHELVFISNLFNSICIHLRSHSAIKNCDYTCTRNFIDIMVKLTCKLLLESVKIKTRFDEEEYDRCNQCIEYLINSIVVIVNLVTYAQLKQEVHPMESCGLNTTKFITVEELLTWTKPLFETYIRVHLSEPEGLLPFSCFQDNDEIQEFEEDDNTLYREQISAIGSIAQVDLLNSINTITQLLIMKLQQFEAFIRSEENSNEKLEIQWIRISEDIHWILMISTYIFTSHAENEIPEEVLKISIHASADIEATVRALQNGDFTPNNIDPVVRYFIVIFKLIQMEKHLLENNMKRWISPQVSYTLTYFISRFMHVYLVPAEFDNDRTEMSLSLNTCFGADSPNAKSMINYLLDHLETKFLTLSSESKVLELSSEGLKTFSKFRERIHLLKECPSLHRLLQRFPSDQNFRKLNQVVRRHMYYVFMVVFVHDNPDLVLNPLIHLYRTFCEKLRSGNINDEVQEEFLLIADFTIGISNGLNASTFNIVWQKFLLPFYNDLSRVLKTMHKYSIVVRAILELLFNFSILFGGYNETDNFTFFNTAISILTEYATLTKYTYLEKDRLEEIELEFIWILKFLNQLSAQDLLFFFANITTSFSETINKIVFIALDLIMPLMNDQLLENETLCSLYYKLLEFISQDTERFKGFPIKLFENYMKCVEYAFKANNISNDIKIIGFKILIELGVQTSREPREEILNFLKPFFKTIIEFIFCELIRNNDQSLRDIVGLALYSLVSCFPNSYRDIIRELMHHIDDHKIEERICNLLFETFNKVRFDCLDKMAFKKRFSKFINDLHTILS